MSTIESQIQKLNDTNAELARVNNELTNTVRTHTSAINNEVAAAKNTMAAATASAISEVKADANAVNAEIKARMDDAVVPWLPAMTKVQFDALRADRKQKYAGSGFVEWGKHSSVYEINANINEGMFCASYNGESSRYSKLTIGSKLGSSGQSSTEFASVLVDGVTLRLSDSRVDVYGIHCTFPEAPDGTKTYDSATGTVTQHTNAEVAFASETATNKVITSRKDLVFLESWHEKITDKDIVYPLGNVQYGATSYEGIALSNNLVAQSYSAFGEWDENTKGYGAKWSSLTDAQKALFLSEPGHNIYYDAKAKIYVQVRYRMRVVEGMSDDWNELRPSVHEITTEWAIANRRRITFVQGSDLSISSTVFLMKDHAQTALTKADNGIAEGEAQTLGRTSFGGTKPLALPIALVQRMNQGAFHPTYNPMGTGKLINTAENGWVHWYASNAASVSSKSACFIDYRDGGVGDKNRKVGAIRGGDGYSGRLEQYKFHDAIYAGQVEDLRLNANKLDVNKLREDTMRKAVAGTLRGKEPTLFTHFKELKSGYYRASNEWNASFYDSPQDGNTIDFFSNGFRASTPVMVWQPATGITLYGTVSNSNAHLKLTDQFSNLGGEKHTNPLSKVGLTHSDICYFAELKKMGSEFDSLPWVDIIGHPERIATTFPNGVIGQWLPKLPDNSSGYPLNRKMTNTALNASYSRDLGATWTNANVGHNALLNTSSGSWNPEVVALLSYESQASFTALANNLNIADNSAGDVFVSLSASTNQGNRLHPSLTNKIGKSGVSDPTFKSYSVASSQVMNDKLVYEPKHQLMDVAKPANNSPAVKALSTITEKNGLYYLQLHGAELKHHTPTFNDVNPSSNTTYTEGNFYCLTNYGAKGYYVCGVTMTFAFYTDKKFIQMENGDIVHGPTNQVVLRKLNTADGGSWGDDQTIPIVNGEDVKTDLNGNVVKVFCHHSQIPLGIVHND
ncbi:hypothetical protein [Pseudoalteromonas aurantia]|uniref:Tail fiber protein n=1 Tax=Pseudoalteromonas aurantia 208 TaxID=1314867 RepID=A0ABR9E9G7_9GAMM|nr:hypothetical protein [Pseudoalteromonas aurantia]MBE0367629.1 hypothetical protein [Pseudoalteromonas aurantia 208]